MLDDVIISKAIIENYFKELNEFLEVDVAIGGAGPAGMIAGYFLSKEGRKVAIFERKLSVGGGMWGGGMMFNKAVFQKSTQPLLDELGVASISYKKDYLVVNTLEMVSCLCLKAIKAGAKIFNLISVEDVLCYQERVSGFVVNFSAVALANLHVDPITIRAKACIDATGHDCEVVKVVERKLGAKLNTPTGKIIGERSMWAEEAEKVIIENTQEVYPGLYVAGMAANAVYGGPRMGAIFGGMLLSGKKVAEVLKNGVHF
jgi:thiamine thiazole synthase